jgi:hypothetical protein
MSAQGMMVTVLATQIAEAVAKDELPENGGCDVSAGLFGPHLSELVRGLVAQMQAAQSPAPAAPAPTIRDVLKPFDDPATGALFAEACDLGGAAPAALRMLTDHEIRQAVTGEGLGFTAPDVRVARGVQIAFAAANNLPLSASPEDTP